MASPGHNELMFLACQVHPSTIHMFLIILVTWDLDKVYIKFYITSELLLHAGSIFGPHQPNKLSDIGLFHIYIALPKEFHTIHALLRFVVISIDWILFNSFRVVSLSQYQCSNPGEYGYNIDIFILPHICNSAWRRTKGNYHPFELWNPVDVSFTIL